MVRLVAPGVLTVDTGATLARYCDGLVRWQAIAAALPVTEVSRQYLDLSTMLLRIEQEFGLTPSARTRIQVTAAQTPAEDPSAEFFGPRAAAG